MQLIVLLFNKYIKKKVLNSKILDKFICNSKLVFNFFSFYNDEIFFKISKTNKKIYNFYFHCFKIFSNKSNDTIVKEYEIIKILLVIIKIFIKFFKIILDFIGLILYSIWSYLTTLFLYTYGYVMYYEFGKGNLYDPARDVSSREIGQIIFKKLNSLKKKYISKEYFLKLFFIFYEKIENKIFYLKNLAISFLVFFYFKINHICKKNVLLTTSIYTYIKLFGFIIIMNTLIFLKNLFNLKELKNEFRKFLYNFKNYFVFNFLKIFIDLFKKKRLFFLNKNFFEKKKIFNINFINNTLDIFVFENYNKLNDKLKYKFLYVKKMYKFNAFKTYFSYRLRFWSIQKRFLYFYIQLLKKSKKIKTSVLRLIYIQEWWIYKFSLKSYFFDLFLKLIVVTYNFIYIKIIFFIDYVNLIVSIIFN